MALEESGLHPRVSIDDSGFGGLGTARGVRTAFRHLSGATENGPHAAGAARRKV